MAESSTERLDRIEAMLAQVTQLLVQTAERQSIVEHEIESTQKSIRELHRALVVDAENIRRLADIALAHQDRIDSHETRIDDLEGGKPQ